MKYESQIIREKCVVNSIRLSDFNIMFVVIKRQRTFNDRILTLLNVFDGLKMDGQWTTVRYVEG